ncbi:TPA: restriction endonuclease subunit S [Streptococcus suis]
MSEVVQLIDLCKEELSGKYGIPAPAEEFDSSKVRYLRITDIDDNGNLLNSDMKSVSSHDINKYLLSEGDIVFARTGNSTGRAYYHQEKNGQLAFAGFLIKFSLDSRKVNPMYLKYYTISSEYRAWVKNLSNGSTRGNINAQTFASCPIKLPERAVQDSLVQIMSTIDQKIALNNQINEELEAMAKTLYNYWFVQFDFPDENGKPYKSSGGKMVYNDQLKREIPEGWGVKQLGELCEFRNGINYEKSEAGDTLSKIVNVRNISNSSTFVTTYDLDSITLDRRRIENYLVTDRTILITRSGIPGATRLVSDIPANTIYSGFIIGATVANLNLFYYVFYHLKNIEMLMSNQSAGTIMKNISQTTLSEIRIAIPNKEIQKVFSNQVRSLLDVIENNLKQNQELTQLRDWLLPMLMNGQVKVE